MKPLGLRPVGHSTERVKNGRARSKRDALKLIEETADEKPAPTTADIEVTIKFTIRMGYAASGISEPLGRVAWADAVHKGLGPKKLAGLGIIKIIPGTRRLSLVEVPDDE